MSHPAYKPPLRFVLRLRLQKGGRICETLRYILKKKRKDVGMACQKVYKQGRDDIIVKVSLQSLIPASFSH